MSEHARGLSQIWLWLSLLAVAAAAACGSSAGTAACFTCTEVTCEPAPVNACDESSHQGVYASPEARFTSGIIDLTGDGVPETVQRDGTQVHIEQDGVEVWRTPSNWEVVDATLGDPNDDGRGELLLAFWREDDPGMLRSHPFIVGYREGIYRTLWGGSAVREAILEVELGDLDGDGIQELVVLEASGKDNQTVAVWRWHGWGFSRQWRSEPGSYSDLALVSASEGVPAIVRVTCVP